MALGAHADNPPVPVILVDGAAPAGAMHAGTEAQLAVAAPLEAHSYRWFSPVGDVTGVTRAEATLDAEAPPLDLPGQVAVVVRDQAGGTAWALAAVEVAP